jgi:hypothetical protein
MAIDATNYSVLLDGVGAVDISRLFQTQEAGKLMNPHVRSEPAARLTNYVEAEKIVRVPEKAEGAKRDDDGRSKARTGTSVPTR